MSKNDFGLDAADRENCALRTAPASLQRIARLGPKRIFVTWRKASKKSVNFEAKRGSVPSYLRPGTGEAQAQIEGLGPRGFLSHLGGRGRKSKSSLKPSRLCAKLPAPRDWGSPGANPRLGLKRVFVTWRKASKKSVNIAAKRGSVPSYLRPGTGEAQAQIEGLDPSGILLHHGGRRRKSKSSLKPSRLCAKLPAPRDWGSPGANPRFGASKK